MPPLLGPYVPEEDSDNESSVNSNKSDLYPDSDSEGDNANMWANHPTNGTSNSNKKSNRNSTQNSSQYLPAGLPEYLPEGNPAVVPSLTTNLSSGIILGVELISILLGKVLLGYELNNISRHFSLNQPAGQYRKAWHSPQRISESWVRTTASSFVSKDE